MTNRAPTTVEQHLRWRYGPCWLDVINVVETVRHATPEQIARWA